MLHLVVSAMQYDTHACRHKAESCCLPVLIGAKHFCPPQLIAEIVKVEVACRYNG